MDYIESGYPGFMFFRLLIQAILRRKNNKTLETGSISAGNLLISMMIRRANREKNS